MKQEIQIIFEEIKNLISLLVNQYNQFQVDFKLFEEENEIKIEKTMNETKVASASLWNSISDNVQLFNDRTSSRVTNLWIHTIQQLYELKNQNFTINLFGLKWT